LVAAALSAEDVRHDVKRSLLRFGPVQCSVRRLPAPRSLVERGIRCHVVEADTPDGAAQLGPSASFVWVLSGARSGSDEDNGAGDRAPRPRPRGGLPSLKAAKPLRPHDGSPTAMDSFVRAWPSDWDEREA